MKFTNILVLYIILFLSSVLTGCEDNDMHSNEKGMLRIEFDSRFGNDDLELDTDYTNSSGEAFRISRLNYYISNLRLHTISGSEFVVPQDSSYFLIMEDKPDSHHIIINGIPAGDYNAVTFTIGVDSLRSTLDISRRTGVLDPARGHDGMYWTWNSGYIFFKMEGTSPSAPLDQENRFYYHIGGYGGYDALTLNNIRETTISMGSARVEVRAHKSPKLHLYVDVEEFFKGPNPFKIGDHSLVMFSEFSLKVSENYVNMFKYDHIHN